MKKIILFAIGLTMFTGCYGAELAQLKQQNEYLQTQNQRLRTVPASQPAAPNAGPQLIPPAAPTPVQTLVQASAATTPVQQNPGGYQCFLGRNPGVGVGRWIKVTNPYGYETGNWLSLGLNNQPVVVIAPAGYGWTGAMTMPKPGVSVLPPGASCYIPIREPRMIHGRMNLFYLNAQVYTETVDSYNRPVLSDQPSSYFPSSSTPESLTWVTLSENYVVTEFPLSREYFN